MSTTTSSAPAATTSATTTDKKDKSNNPLLFFVALGFGVVFTNLWIIVGVKYCFRYNARNRAARMLNEHGEPIDLGDIPQAHRRRRKEKKLMSMQEVNERFPLTKYKVFRSSREAVGVSAEGGVTSPPSRAASVRGVDGGNDTTVVVVGKTPDDTAPPHTALAIAQQDHASAVTGAPRPSQQSTDTIPEKKDLTTTVRSSSLATNEEDDEDDPIRTAAPAELLDVPGDICAICIDTLDDDDDVRGLTCGHAFHGSCVDPWLTSRRACCPLCKADYYVPKAGRGGAAGGEGEDENGRAGYPGMPQSPASAWIGPGFRPHMLLTSRGFFMGDPMSRVSGPSNTRGNTTTITSEGNAAARPGFFARMRAGAPMAANPTTTGGQTNTTTHPTFTTETPTSGRNWRSMVPRLTRGGNEAAQLEAGTRTVR